MSDLEDYKDAADSEARYADELLAKLEKAEAARDQAVADVAALRGALQWIATNVQKSGYAKMAAVHKARQALAAEHPGDKLLAVVNAARELTNAVAEYRHQYMTHGDGHIGTRRAWDRMSRAHEAMDTALKENSRDLD